MAKLKGSAAAGRGTAGAAAEAPEAGSIDSRLRGRRIVGCQVCPPSPPGSLPLVSTAVADLSGRA
eukprot:scaffold48_cov395-Prasinococcus_capsulatus_cf.AAC.48